MTSYLIVDVETAGLPECADMLDAPQAPANYKDPLKIAAYVAEAKAAQLEKLALDPDTCRIVTMVWQRSDGERMQAIIPDEATEREVLGQFWDDYINIRHPVESIIPLIDGEDIQWFPTSYRSGGSVVGFHISRFDLPVLLRRSLYLGVKAPRVDLSRYRHHGIEDLAQTLSLDWTLPMHSLAFYAKRFGLGEALGKGSEVGAMIAAGDYESVLAHNVRDVELTTALARRMGVIS